MPACPQSKAFLNRLYPAETIILGTSHDPFQHLTLEDFTKTLPPDLNKLVISDKGTYQDIKKIIGKTASFKQLALEGNEFTWTQDYFKTLVDQKGARSIFAIPHADPDIRNMTRTLAKTCDIPVEKNFSEKDYPFDEVDSGDFGGNIYPLTDKVLIVGDNMSQSMLNQLHQFSTQNTIAIETSWFETGHVDELISLLPAQAKKGHCPFTLAIASPAIAMQLVNIDSFQRAELLNFKPFFNETSDDFSRCLSLLAKSYKISFNSPICKKLKQFNIEVMKRINRNLSIITEAMQKIHQCELKNIIEFPVLLAPIDKSKDEEIMGLHRFINPNPLNNVLIGKNVYLSKQYYDQFTDYLKTLLQVMGLTSYFIEGTMLHDMGGGLHCNTQVIRNCRPEL